LHPAGTILPLDALARHRQNDTLSDSLLKSREKLTELGNMLVRGLSIEEIARRLRRDHGDVRDKVAEVGRACR
jgi:DNA-binding NarL/FixJ family response regulator